MHVYIDKIPSIVLSLICGLKKGKWQSLKVTLQQIADIAGVSRGTVDRAIHNRAGIHPQVRERILTVAENLGYLPNIDDRQLTARKLHVKIGVILPARVKGFWEDVHQGIDSASNELADFGTIIIRKVYQKYTADEQLTLIDQLLKEHITGLAIVPVNDLAVQKRLNDLIGANIPVVLLNTEIENVLPLSYIGADYLFSGRTAAGILNLVEKRHRTELLIFTGSEIMLSHTMRITGFLQELNRLQADYHLISIYRLYDKTGISDSMLAYQAALNMLQKHPETTTVFTAAGAVHAVAKAIYDNGMSGRITHLSFDLNDSTYPALQNGSLSVVIGQEAFKQGYQPIKLLFDYLVNGIEPPSRRIILHNEILIQQNASNRLFF